MRGTENAGHGPGRALLTVGVLGAVLLTGCADEEPEPEEPALTIRGTAQAVERSEVLHWKGAWNWRTGSAPDAPTTRVTADLRALPAGDVHGTLRADGHTATVAHIAQASTFVKADRTMWREVFGTDGDRTDAFAGRWVEIRGAGDTAGTGGVLGLDLGWLSPRSQGTELSSYHPDGDDAPWTPARSAPSRFSRPPGVPSDALRFRTRARDGVSEEGVYWVDAERPRRLLGYTGMDARVTDQSPAAQSRAGMVRLSVREEDARAAKRAYAGLRSAVAGLGRTVPVETERGDDGVQVDEGSEACGPECSSVAVPVTVENTMEEERVRPRVEVTLSGGEPGTLPDFFPELGTCRLRLGELAPGAKAEGGCTVTGRKLRKAVEEAGKTGPVVNIDFKVETALSSEIHAPSHKDEVAKALRNNAADSAAG
ncbi:hypothetical protein FM076_02405 [Streptomyces albus subsp. chlorinus]|uniref:hypothetical protein n=1 Tax=Streptomyces albus TaxID=1888 RepID=UPI00156EFFE2|nr:hypothetical protein [Streptomyces albus]NSC20121.1 hypothetical protein [Streptomyces albus subsp. chlorinus]